MTARKTARATIRANVPPAPVTADIEVLTDAINPVTLIISGVNFIPSTHVLLIPVINTGTVLTPTGAPVVTLAPQDVLETISQAFTMATPADGDTYEIFLQSPNVRRVHVGTLSIADPPDPP